jgi:hypothetical protein
MKGEKMINVIMIEGISSISVIVLLSENYLRSATAFFQLHLPAYIECKLFVWMTIFD